MGNYLKKPRGKKLSKSDEVHRVDADTSAKKVPRETKNDEKDASDDE